MKWVQKWKYRLEEHVIWNPRSWNTMEEGLPQVLNQSKDPDTLSDKVIWRIIEAKVNHLKNPRRETSVWINVKNLSTPTTEGQERGTKNYELEFFWLNEMQLQIL